MSFFSRKYALLFLGIRVWGSVATFVVHFGHVRDELDDATRVAPLVVVPRDELGEVGVEGNSSGGVEDRRVRVTHKVGRDDRVVGVAEDALCNSHNLAHGQLRRE